MKSSKARFDPAGNAGSISSPLVDPRRGDIEDDAASPGQRSLLAIAGSLLVGNQPCRNCCSPGRSRCCSRPCCRRLHAAGGDGVAFFGTLDRLYALTEFGAALVLITIAALGWSGWRPLFRVAETNFWSLNALAVQPGYALCREALRHIAERLFPRYSAAGGRARLHAISSAGAGIIVCVCAALIAILGSGTASRWIKTVTDIAILHHLVVPMLANAVVLVSGYLAVASLAWGFADVSMDQPIDLATFEEAPPGGRTWRVAHLSDLHVVAEPYGFRIESGRDGPRGNERFVAAHGAPLRLSMPPIRSIICSLRAT